MMKKINEKMKNRKGFTLVELIVVIAILGILAAIAVPRFSNIQKNARIDSDIATAETIVNAAKIHIASSNMIWTDAVGIDVDALVDAKLLEEAPVAQVNKVAMDLKISGTEAEPVFTVTATDKILPLDGDGKAEGVFEKK